MVIQNEKGLPYADKLFLDVSEVDLTPTEDVIINSIKFKDIYIDTEIINPIYDFSNVPLTTFSTTEETTLQYTIEPNKTLIMIILKKIANNVVMIMQAMENNSAVEVVRDIRISLELATLLGYSGYIYVNNGLQNIPSYLLVQFVNENNIEVFSKVEPVTSVTSSSGYSGLVPSNIDMIFNEDSFDFSNMDMPWLQQN